MCRAFMLLSPSIVTFIVHGTPEQFVDTKQAVPEHSFDRYSASPQCEPSKIVRNEYPFLFQQFFRDGFSDDRYLTVFIFFG
mmetsp:Transcript_125559/g.250496  ORF Transcript_125559/g.250496 Transcript_125559/m.250496 type:complete len:81 (+) Transcript_125559:420-662(+)